MSRLTDTEYLIRHETLARLWRGNHRRFSYLTAKQQRDLHDYLQTTRQATDDELIEHRSHMTEADPSLPHRASRAYLALLRPPEPATTAPQGRKRVSLKTVIKPEIDFDLLAAALLDVVASLPANERAKLAADGRTIRDRRKKRAA